MKTGFIFPGQGSQICKMGEDFYQEFSCSRQIYEDAGRLLGFSMTDLCFQQDDRLDQTEYTQAALLTTSLAMMEAVKELGITADVAAGLSLGEYGALVAAGVFTEEDAIRLVRQRGILMQEATDQGMMAAVLGMTAQEVESVLQSVNQEHHCHAQIANYNCPGQLVISGLKAEIIWASQALAGAGAKRVIPLNVSGPFHSSYLEEAGNKLGEFMKDLKIHDPEIPYVANVTAQMVYDREEIKPLLIRQVSSSVRWQQSVETMLDQGVDTFIEIGPGKTLTGFIKKIGKGRPGFEQVRLLHVGSVEDWKELKMQLEGEKV